MARRPALIRVDFNVTNMRRPAERVVDFCNKCGTCGQGIKEGKDAIEWMRLSTTRHISIDCCQSRLLRAKRETSRVHTAPTLPRQTSATIRSKPERCVPPAAERPRSSSITSIYDQPNAIRRSRMAY